MQKKGANISLKGYDDIFSTDQSRAEAQLERVQEIPLSELHPFEGHPFRVVDDEDMMKTVESVRDFGVLTPAIVRPDPYGGYEIISGHRRHRASELAGKETMPVIVREMDDDAAIILMVDANLQRETILPSERAYAYKMKLDAIKHQGQRSDLTSGQVVQKLWSVEKVAEGTGESYKNELQNCKLSLGKFPQIAFLQFSGRNDGMVVCDLFVIHNLLCMDGYIIHALHGECVESQLYDVRQAACHIVSQKSAVRSGVSDQFLLIEVLGVVQSLLCRIAQHTVGISL